MSQPPGFSLQRIGRPLLRFLPSGGKTLILLTHVVGGSPSDAGGPGRNRDHPSISKCPQKHVATSSTEESIVLDCFSGSGTTPMPADQLNRSWIGIDSIDSPEIAIKTALGKLKGRVEPAQASLFTRANDNILYLAA